MKFDYFTRNDCQNEWHNLFDSQVVFIFFFLRESKRIFFFFLLLVLFYIQQKISSAHTTTCTENKKTSAQNMTLERHYICHQFTICCVVTLVFICHIRSLFFSLRIAIIFLLHSAQRKKKPDRKNRRKH